jgi:hypothetical protein
VPLASRHAIGRQCRFERARYGPAAKGNHSSAGHNNLSMVHSEHAAQQMTARRLAKGPRLWSGILKWWLHRFSSRNPGGMEMAAEGACFQSSHHPMASFCFPIILQIPSLNAETIPSCFPKVLIGFCDLSFRVRTHVGETGASIGCKHVHAASDTRMLSATEATKVLIMRLHLA